MSKTLQALNASNSPPASSAGTATPGARVSAYQLPPAQARLSKVPVHQHMHAVLRGHVLMTMDAELVIPTYCCTQENMHCWPWAVRGVHAG